MCIINYNYILEKQMEKGIQNQTQYNKLQNIQSNMVHSRNSDLGWIFPIEWNMLAATNQTQVLKKMRFISYHLLSAKHEYVHNRR